MKWAFATIDNSESYTFEISPNAAESRVAAHAATLSYYRSIDTPTGVFAGVLNPRVPTPWSFSGVFRSAAQMDAMTYWCSKREKILITDHLSRTSLIRLNGITISQVAPAQPQAPYRHTYTVRAQVYGVAAPAAPASMLAFATLTADADSGAGEAALSATSTLTATAS